MMKKIVLASTLSSILLLSACAQIPQASIDVNKQVSSGITTLGENGQEMIKAWETLSYAILDQKWSSTYKRAEDDFRLKRGLSDDDPLSYSDREMIAGLAALFRSEERQAIRDHVDKMRDINNDNIDKTLAANKSVTELLISANAVGTSRRSAMSLLEDVTPISEATSKAMKALKEKLGTLSLRGE